MSDGKIGTISDFLFDDTSWLVRWLVVDTGNWLSGRKVLLPSSAMDRLDRKQEECSINLTIQQIEESPNIATDRPVSRQMETDVYGYYGYSPYWNSGYGMMGGMGLVGGYGYMGGMGGAMPISPKSQQREEAIANANAHRNSGDVHLRSVKEVTGYSSCSGLSVHCVAAPGDHHPRLLKPAPNANSRARQQTNGTWAI